MNAITRTPPGRKTAPPERGAVPTRVYEVGGVSDAELDQNQDPCARHAAADRGPGHCGRNLIDLTVNRFTLRLEMPSRVYTLFSRPPGL
jgi:hypothetical protein